MDPKGPVRSPLMPSYTDEQRQRAIEVVEECGGSVTRAMRNVFRQEELSREIINF